MTVVSTMQLRRSTVKKLLPLCLVFYLVYLAKFTLQREEEILPTMEEKDYFIRPLLPVGSPPQERFVIVVLTMNRFDSLKRLLASLRKTDFLSDAVDLQIRFDLPLTPTPEWKAQVELFQQNLEWEAGEVSVITADENMGLRSAWLNAWIPQDSPYQQAIIFEDDIEVSPLWYQWLQGARSAYRNRTDVAGISLQRQTLVPLKTARKNQIPDNGGEPFLYRLVGSIGYSPTAEMWSDFLDFADCALPSGIKVDTPELVTSDWYNTLDQRTMWTQLFIYFCKYRDVSTLYVFPHGQTALASHWREKGEHFKSTAGRDFPIALNKDLSFQYPAKLIKLDWDARPVPLVTKKPRVVVLAAAVGYPLQDYQRFSSSLRKHYSGDVALLIASDASREIKDVLTSFGIQTQATKEKGGPRTSAAWSRINQVRWSFYESLCSADVYDLCMAIDFRDTLFQDDPFWQMPAPSSKNVLHVYEHYLVMNEWHLNEAYKCKRTNQGMKGNMIINAGGFIGTPGVFPKLSDMVQNYGRGCDDQVALNLGIYSGQLKDVNIVSHAQGEGSINNAAWGGRFRYDSRRRILNHNCFPAPAVHQFDKVDLHEE